MAYPVSGSPYSGSSASPAYSGRFIPEIWAGKLIEKFYKATVFGAICNTDYEGEITSYGDKVTIRQRPDITINSYSADQALTVERPSSAIVELLIDQGKYFNTVLDDVFKVQSDINMMDEWATDAAEQMKITIDKDVLDYMLGTATAVTNRGQTAGAISADIDLGITTAPEALTTGDLVLALLVNMGTVMDEANLPETGRWVILPAWACGRLKLSDLKDASLAGDGTSILRNGRVGMIDRFTVYMSNQLPDAAHANLAAGEYAVFAGINNAVSFASQMTNTETLRSESTFGTLMRGLQVYGRKTTDPNSLVEAIVSK